MYIRYKVNVSENQVDTLKDAIRLKKDITLCFPKCGIKGDLVTYTSTNQPIGQSTSGREMCTNLYEC